MSSDQRKSSVLESIAGASPGQGTNGTSVSTSASSSDSTTTAATSGRRPSTDQKFAGLSDHKRSSDTAAQHKASWSEQQPEQPGVVGKMWQSFTRGA